MALTNEKKKLDEMDKKINEQIQNVIDQVTSKTIFLGNDQNHVPLKTTNGDASCPPIPKTTSAAITI